MLLMMCKMFHHLIFEEIYNIDNWLDMISRKCFHSAIKSLNVDSALKLLECMDTMMMTSKRLHIGYRPIILLPVESASFNLEDSCKLY